MRSVRLGALAVALLAVTVFSSITLSQEKKSDAMQQGQQDDMAAWAAAAQPGPEHQQLKQHFEGTWDAEVKSNFGGTEEVTTGTSMNKLVLGGRILVQHYKGTAMGMPFEGMGTTGYDNMTKKYFGSWMDTMGTGMMVTEGTWDPDTQTYTFTGEMPMPGGMSSKVREVVKVISNDKNTFEMFMEQGGNEMKVMTITYTRKK